MQFPPEDLKAAFFYSEIFCFVYTSLPHAVSQLGVEMMLRLERDAR